MEKLEADLGSNEPDTDAYLKSLIVTNPLAELVIPSAIRALELPPGSRGLDAGCGIGLQSLLLAEAVGPGGHVTGLDVAPPFLARGRDIVQEAGFSERISFREGSVAALPCDDDTFDWVWSSNCVGYGPWEPLPLVRELARVVKPGGIVALLAWSSEQLLPGYPLLEARLLATSAGLAPFTKRSAPERHFLRSLGLFRELGLRDPQARTFVGGAQAPLSADLREALIALIEMRWPGVESELVPEEAAEFRRLCKPESPDFLLDHPDYYAFFTETLFWCKVA